MLIQTQPEHFPPLASIVTHTPFWVWGLLAGLVAMGLSQTLPRRVGASRVLILPIAMSALSLWGTAAAFGRSPMLAGVLLAWALAAATAFAWVARREPDRGTRYDPATGDFHMPGSFWPLALILAIFLLRYAVNAALAVQPTLALDSVFGLAVGAFYGVCCGFFAGRAARMWRLAFGGLSLAALPGSVRRLIGGDPW